MNIPRTNAARKALEAMHSDTATVQRAAADAASNSMQTETVYTALGCHLSVRNGLGAHRTASLSQTVAQAQVKTGYTVFFPYWVTVLPGDMIMVTHGNQTVSGRAGLSSYGTLGIAVPLDSVVIA